MRLVRRSLGGGVRIVVLALVLWLVIGALAAGQRHYFSRAPATCSRAGTTAATIVAGPLNYLGVNPKISCAVPQPSS